MWKRFVAEFIDFLILFVVKLVVTFIAVDTFELIDMEQLVEISMCWNIGPKRAHF